MGRLMAIRNTVQQHGKQLYCHKGLAHANVMATMSMQQAAATLPNDTRRALLVWLTQHGPFWLDQRQHSANDWLECNGEIVTDTAIGEAAWCLANHLERATVSITPSNWSYTPILVDEIRTTTSGQTETQTTPVKNYWEEGTVRESLLLAPAPLASWAELGRQSVLNFTHLTFSDDAFAPLDGHPFVPGAAEQMYAVLGILNRFKACFDEHGKRTPEGNEIYQNFFTGNATFTDSSESEKNKFEKELEFWHPDYPFDPKKKLFCPWHGKVQTPQLRTHFTYPVRHDAPLYVVYVGPKITKR